MSKKVLIIIILILIIIATLVVVLITNRTGSSNGNNPSSFTVQNVKVDITREGRGDDQVEAGDFLVVNYMNRLEDGTKIDSTYDQGRRPLTFKVGAGQVLKGWDAGLLGMKVGEIRKLTVPSEMGFGDAGFPVAGIPKNATLISEVELLAIQN